MEQNNTIHQLSFLVKSHKVEKFVNEDNFHFGDNSDFFGDERVF
ncbi:hypothetical protein [Polaribacter haliotis]|nr:hypothetical protein [Polaribacter haliotis]